MSRFPRMYNVNVLPPTQRFKIHRINENITYWEPTDEIGTPGLKTVEDMAAARKECVHAAGTSLNLTGAAEIEGGRNAWSFFHNTELNAKAIADEILEALAYPKVRFCYYSDFRVGRDHDVMTMMAELAVYFKTRGIRFNSFNKRFTLVAPVDTAPKDTPILRNLKVLLCNNIIQVLNANYGTGLRAMKLDNKDNANSTNNMVVMAKANNIDLEELLFTTEIDAPFDEVDQFLNKLNLMGTVLARHLISKDDIEALAKDTQTWWDSCTHRADPFYY